MDMIYKELEKKILGDRLRIALVVSEEGGLFLKISLVHYSGNEVSYITATPFLVIRKDTDGNNIPALAVELASMCDSREIRLPENIRSEYAVFDVAGAWKLVDMKPLDDITDTELHAILERQIAWRER